MKNINLLLLFLITFTCNAISVSAQMALTTVDSWNQEDIIEDFLDEEEVKENLFSENLSILSSKKRVYKCERDSLAIGPVVLNIPKDALRKSYNIQLVYCSINQLTLSLPDDVLPLLPQDGAVQLTPGSIEAEGQFLLSVKIDKTQMPAWGRTSDIKGLFYHPVHGKWQLVPLDAYNEQTQMATFLTDPFTDFVAGIIQSPEHPTTTAHLQTGIKDFQVPKPDANITQVSPPEVNNEGTANLSFPFQVPPGRAGMTPSISLNYNSSGGNGWLGLGWSMSTPTITIDTRWGVPRYDAELETETYLYNGQQLYPVAHRNEWVARQTERVFYPRVEGSFAEIIRHGDHPNNYWWEVIEINGERKFFGKRSVGNSNDNLTLKDLDENISTWFLAERRDANENFIAYTYQQQSDDGPSGNMTTGYNLYLDKIEYTGHGQETGVFNVSFIRDQQLEGEEEEPRRIDAFQDGSMGFKKVTASLLRKVEVRQSNELIRSYELRYQEGVYGKMLLDSIEHLDNSGNLFYGYGFVYYNDTQEDSIFKPLTTTREAVVPGDDLKGNLTAAAIGYQNETTAIGGNRANNYSLGISVTIGPPGSTFLKKNTGGGHYSFSQTKGFGINTLLDLNGDSRPDKIFVENGEIKIRFNLGELGGVIQFGEQITLLGSSEIKEISTSKTRSHSYGGEANLKAGSFTAYISTATTKTKTTTPIYFQDFNADGLLDLAYNRRVFFNRLDENGIPTFWATSSGTPNPIQAGEPISEELAFQQDEEEEDEPTFEEENPLHDAVRVWIIPYDEDDTDLVITGTVRLLEDESDEATSYLNKDGVRVSVEFEDENTPLWTRLIDTSDYNTYQFSERITNFDKDEMIFFRTHSIDDGAYDQTVWDIQIEYRDEVTDTLLIQFDANGKNVYAYDSQEDFHLVSPQEMGVPMKGEVRLVGNYNIAPLTDTLHMIIEKRQDTNVEDGVDSTIIVREVVVPPGEAFVDTFTIDEEVNVGDRLAFCAVANSNVDWQKVQWNPVIEYNYTEAEDGTIDSTGASNFRQCAAVDMRMFNQINEQAPYFIILDSGDVNARIAFPLQPNNTPQSTYYNGEGRMYISFKGREAHYGSTYIEPSSNPLSNPYVFEIVIPQSVRQGDTLYIDVHFTSDEMTQHFVNNNRSAVTVNDHQVKNVLEPNRHFNTYSELPEELRPLGTLYRQWGQFSYNAEGETGENVIDRNIVWDALRDYRETSVGDFDNDDPEELEAALNPTRKPVGIMYANKDSVVWQGYDNLLYINDSIASSSRLGEDNRIFTVGSGDDGGEGLSAPVKISRVKSKSKSGGIGFQFPLQGTDSLQTNASVMDSSTESWQQTDLIDVNLDGYPDLIANGMTQPTTPRGGRSEQLINHGAHTQYAKAGKTGFTISGSLQEAQVSNTGINAAGVNFTSNSMSTSQNLALSKQATIGLSGFVDRNKDETDSSWQDVDGDGLPDIISKEGTIRMNFGYHFGEEENWHNIEVRKGESVTKGASASLTGIFSSSKVNGSWTLGVSTSKSENHSTYGLQDVTGDGLADILTIDDAGDLYAQINLGQQYTEPMLWKTDFLLDEGLSVSESINGAFTICINFIFVRLCLNPKGHIGRSVSMPLTKIADLNGDGFPDFLRSSKDDNLSYHLSTFGRTNKLQAIHGPLGAETTLDYNFIPPSYEQGSGKWVLSSVAVDDGLAGDGANIQKKQFIYTDGFKERREREFYGFAEVVTEELDTENNDQVYRRQCQTYANDTYYRKGLLLSSRIEDADSNLYHVNIQQYELRNPETGSSLGDDFADDDQSAFPALITSTTSLYEGLTEAGIIHVKNYDYDTKGNTITYTDFANDRPEAWVKAEIDYHSIANKGIFNIPSQIDIVDSDNNLLRRRNSSVDPKGNITQINQYLNPGTTANSEYEYDSRGNINHITRPPNDKGERMTYSITYDPILFTYPISIHDTYGYRSTTTYNYHYGLPLVSTDMNDQELTYTYDSRGRLDTLTSPYEKASGQSYTISMEYNLDADVPYALCKHYEPETGGDILTATFIDGLGRPVQIKKSGEIFTSSNTPDEALLIVSGKVIYDPFGRKTASYYNTTEAPANLLLYNSVPDNVDATSYTYDVLDRELSITLPDGALTEKIYTITDDPDGAPANLLTVIDPLNNKQEQYTDYRGRKTAAVMYGPTGAITTRFKYNAISELLEVIDDDGNITRSVYDRLGRKTIIDHPVAGIIELAYDLLGNITKKTTPNIRERIGEDAGIRYEYDYERIKTIAYPENFQNNVRYTYGNSTALFNRRGKIQLQEDGSGAQEFFYGPMGEVVKIIRTLTISPTETRTYVSEARYDSWNRIQELYYPDGEKVSYTYNGAGKLVGMAGIRFGKNYAYINRIAYDKFEKRRFIQFGNGAEQEYVYEPTRERLQNMQAQSQTAGTFLNVNYSYDAVDNILTMTNTAVPNAGQIGGDYSCSYTYDQLYRLTNANGSWSRSDRTESFSLAMGYDNTHNIVRKNQTRLRDQSPFDIGTYDNIYSYNQDKPFMPSMVGDQSCRYDANGNLVETRDTTRLLSKEFSWDEENRLKTVLENGYLSQYSYDANGERTVKSHGPIQGVSINGVTGGFVGHTANYTAYVSPYMVAKEGTYTKHYYIEGQRIVSKVGQGTFANNSAGLNQGQFTAGNINFTERERQIQAGLLVFLGDTLIPYHPNMPLFYAQPEQTGTAWPGLFPDSIEVQTPTASLILMPNRPALDRSQEASHPSWGNQQPSADSVRAGYGLQDSLAQPEERLRYFYHSDHVGSTAYITDRDGAISQFATYTPFGELFVEDVSLSVADGGLPYLFNGKELDRETGLAYYGARYYDPQSSIWLSLDPMMEKYPGWSPYNFTMLNPVRLVDPDGQQTFDPERLKQKTNNRNANIREDKRHQRILNNKAAQAQSNLNSMKKTYANHYPALENDNPSYRPLTQPKSAGKAGALGVLGLAIDALNTKTRRKVETENTIAIYRDINIIANKIPFGESKNIRLFFRKVGDYNIYNGYGDASKSYLVPTGTFSQFRQIDGIKGLNIGFDPTLFKIDLPSPDRPCKVSDF